MARYVFRDGRLVDKDSGVPLEVPEEVPSGAPYIASDIQPYQSMIDGSMITSRSRHRAHLRDHGCIEIGNEKMEAAKPPQALKSQERRRLLHQQLANVTDKQADKVLAGLKDIAIQHRNQHGR